MNICRASLMLLVGCLACPCALVAEETEIEAAAARLLSTTVTVRISATPGKTNAAEPATAPPQAVDSIPADAEAPQIAKSPASAAPAVDGVTVCSGASLGKGLIITFGRLAAAASNGGDEFQYRVTLPDGEQSSAQPRVIDHYSGLVLLEIPKLDLPALELAPELPKIGGTVLTAAAAGIERPLVSMGVLSGVDRTIRGSNLPPLVQCDVSTTEASSGAAVIDKQARLIGIISATGSPGENFGWTYAIPARYVERILAAKVDDRLVVLVQRRPTLGLKLGPGPQEGSVLVERVEAGGPAARAGIKQGDLLVEADGRKIRSAYQAVALILTRQPGEKMTFVVGPEDRRRTVEVTLGGAATVVSNPAANGAEQVHVGPQLNMRVAGPNRIEVRNRQGIAELSVDGENPRERATERSPGNETELLKAQLQAYQNVILTLQKDLIRRKAAEAEMEQQLESLRKEVSELRKK